MTEQLTTQTSAPPIQSLYDTELEKYMLSAILNHEYIQRKFIPLLKPDYFAIPEHRENSWQYRNCLIEMNQSI